MRLLLLFAMTFAFNFGLGQCPTQILSKNGSCVKITYETTSEADAAVAGTGYTATVTQSTTGADGTWTAIEICSGSTVLYEKTGGNCNCSGNFNLGEDGKWTFSTGDICEYFNGTLPVIYSQLYIEKDDGAILHWMTSSEIKNNYYAIERSKDGKSFETIGQIKASGDSSTDRKYAYLDPRPHFGLSYYRIVQVDYDGTSSPSEILTFRNFNGEDQVFYNVSSNQIDINNVNENKSYALSNYAGIIFNKGNLSQGMNNLNTSNLPVGIYLVTLVGQEMRTYKVVVR